MYHSGEDNPTYFKLGKNQTIILVYIEVNGVREEIELHSSNQLREILSMMIFILIMILGMF